MIVVDSNVLIDVFDQDAKWYDWSVGMLHENALQDNLVVTQIVVAEVAPRYSHLDDFLDAIDAIDISVQVMTDDAAFSAGLAFRRYIENRRTRSAEHKTIIADFLIGGQAHVLDAKILTRDPRIFRAYFPNTSLITPDKAE